jgi:peroxiredoxin
MGWKFLAAIVLLGTLIILRHLTSLPERDEMILLPRHSRHPFPLDFTLPNLQGENISLSKQQDKVLLLNFWATWCYPCRFEMPSINAVFKRYQSKSFVVLAIASDTLGQEVVSPFARQNDLSFPILLDPQDVVGRRLQLPGIPATYVLDKQGRVAIAAFGAKDWNSPSMHRLFDALLAEKGPRP